MDSTPPPSLPLKRQAEDYVFNSAAGTSKSTGSSNNSRSSSPAPSSSNSSSSSSTKRSSGSAPKIKQIKSKPQNKKTPGAATISFSHTACPAPAHTMNNNPTQPSSSSSPSSFSPSNGAVPTAGTITLPPKRPRRRSGAPVQPVPRSAKPHGELLTADEKKANHIASEQKRRQAIREGFDKIAELVPDLDKTQGRSEATVLIKTVNFLHMLIDENNKLVELAKSHNIPIPSDSAPSTEPQNAPGLAPPQPNAPMSSINLQQKQQAMAAGAAAAGMANAPASSTTETNNTT